MGAQRTSSTLLQWRRQTDESLARYCFSIGGLRSGIAECPLAPYYTDMVASALTRLAEESGLDELLRPEPLADGTEPEQRIIYCPISWDRYLAFDKKLGDDRPGPRLYYLDSELEIMTTSNEHERVKRWIGG